MTGPKIHADLYQGSDEWLAARRGLLTASEMHLIVTPTLKIAANEKERSHLYELLAQRISGYVEPSYVSADMLRGMEDEIDAIALYSEHIAPTEQVGFITNGKWGFTLGYSPDALVGDDGLVECKSRRQKFQVETFIRHVAEGTIPPEYMMQIQTGLLVSERTWCDFVSYHGGLPMAVIRAYPDPVVHEAIVSAAEAFEGRLSASIDAYFAALTMSNPILTKRRIEQEITI